MSPALKKSDVERLVRGIYSLELDDQRYLDALRMLWAATPFGSTHTLAFAWRGNERGDATIDTLSAPSPEVEQAFAQVYAATSRSVRLSMLRLEPHFGVMTARFPGTKGHRRSTELGFPDFSALFGPTRTGSVVVVGTPLTPGTPRHVRSDTGDRLSAHLAGVWRLRQRLAAPDGFQDNAEAVFAPEGRLHEANGPAQRPELRDRLRALVLAREKALATQDLRLWPALLDGRYTIADRFERSGKRYVVAFRNDPTAAKLNRLTALERQIVERVASGVMEKVIAIDLGLSLPRVSNVLRAALLKLRLAGAIELSLVASSSTFVTLDDELLGKRIVAAFELRGEASAGLAALTPAERAVTADLLRGLSNREIAARRNRSERTIANQVSSVLEKLKVASRRGLAVKLGQVPERR